jgi:hypothetical protein
METLADALVECGNWGWKDLEKISVDTKPNSKNFTSASVAYEKCKSALSLDKFKFSNPATDFVAYTSEIDSIVITGNDTATIGLNITSSTRLAISGISGGKFLSEPVENSEMAVIDITTLGSQIVSMSFIPEQFPIEEVE